MRIKPYTPAVPHGEAERRARSLAAELSLEQKCALVGGHNRDFIWGIEKIGFPEIYMSDATMGFARRDYNDGLGHRLEKSTAFPCFLQLAATWNRDLAKEYARCIGEESRAAGLAVLLGPGMNIYRHSQCGRNFEYAGEDPFLAARIVENYVVGMQETGTAATLKHFVCNNTDFFRRKSNSIVDERTLHEIYLPAFKAGVDAGAMAVMTSYNLLNGEWCGQSSYALNDLLRGHLGFKWLVMTDWTSVWDAVKIAGSGQDLEMPHAETLKDAAALVREGEIDESEIDRMVVSIIKTIVALGFLDAQVKKPELAARIDSHQETALKAAEEGVVLLRNEGATLPIGKGQKVLLTGKYAESFARGGGSAKVEGYSWLTLAEALNEELGNQILCNIRPSDDEIRSADLIILAIGTEDSEGWDRPFELPEEDEAAIHRVLDLNPNTVVVVNSGSGIRMTGWYEKTAAILYAWYGGQIGNQAVARVLSGSVNPSGKLPITIEREFSDSPGFGYLPELEELYSGRHNKDEEEHPVYDVCYDEGVFVGYRWYDEKGIEPLYPFGFGLSFTEFEYSDPALSHSTISPNDELEITFTLSNTGDSAGSEIVQLYLHDIESALERPQKELRGFEKVHLNPGESKVVRMTISGEDCSYWHSELKKWHVEPGFYSVLIGASSRDIRLNADFEVISK
jgi:beta-glucosidase